MTIKSIMSKNVVCVDMDDSLGFVKALFNSHKFHHLLVVDNEKLVGVISDRDLFKAISPNCGTAVATRRDDITLNKRAHQIMSRHPITLNINDNFYDAVDLFLQEKISCLPVINQDLKPVGIVTWGDVLKVISSHYHRKVAEAG